MTVSPAQTVAGNGALVERFVEAVWNGDALEDLVAGVSKGRLPGG